MDDPRWQRIDAFIDIWLEPLSLGVRFNGERELAFDADRTRVNIPAGMKSVAATT
jgi:hypothetical protein